ncbi:MAG: hypothetical protein Q9184_006180 [Pyrenodesmia sp. 2 TL-2023]
MANPLWYYSEHIKACLSGYIDKSAQEEKCFGDISIFRDLTGTMENDKRARDEAD